MSEAKYPIGTPQSEIDRSCGIGGSDAPVIALGDVYGKTPAKLYLEKLGRVPGFEGNENTELGNLLEPYLRNWAQGFLGCVIEEVPPWMPHPEREWQCASLDGLVRADNAMVEIKTTGLIEKWGESWNPDGIPDAVQIQCQHNMVVSDTDRALVIVADVRGLAGEVTSETHDVDFLTRLANTVLTKRVYELPRDYQYGEDLTKAEAEFMRCLEEKTPPSSMDLDDVKALYPTSTTGTVLEVDEEMANNVYALASVRAAIRKLSAQEKEISGVIGAVLRTNSALAYGGQELMRWGNPKGFDEELLRQKQPDIYRDYCNKFDGTLFKKDHAKLREQFMRPGLGRRSMTFTKTVLEALEKES